MRVLKRLAVASGLILAAFAGCGTKEPEGNELIDPAEAKANAGRTTADQEIGGKLSEAINDASEKYHPLRYEYDEDLLKLLDRVETRLAGKSEKLDPLVLPTLDEAEQLAHFKETIKRWNAKTKKDLRTVLDPLIAEVAARKPGGPPFHPEFHKKFAAEFDSFIPIEVEEIRERRNRAIHEKAKSIFDEYRKTDPDAVKPHEKTLNAPPYNLTKESTTAPVE